MHELSLAANLLTTVEQAAVQQGFDQVKSVHIAVGELSCVDAEALQFALQAISQNTLLDGAEVLLQTVRGELQCRHCQHRFYAKELYSPCPACNQYGAAIIAGNDACLSALDVYATPLTHQAIDNTTTNKTTLEATTKVATNATTKVTTEPSDV